MTGIKTRLFTLGPVSVPLFSSCIFIICVLSKTGEKHTGEYRVQKWVETFSSFLKLKVVINWSITEWVTRSRTVRYLCPIPCAGGPGPGSRLAWIGPGLVTTATGQSVRTSCSIEFRIVCSPSPVLCCTPSPIPVDAQIHKGPRWRSCLSREIQIFKSISSKKNLTCMKY